MPRARRYDFVTVILWMLACATAAILALLVQLVAAVTPRGEAFDPRDRPMFSQVVTNDRGTGWRPVPPVRDSNGTVLVIDSELNIVVVFVIPGTSLDFSYDSLTADRALLCRGRSYETSVQASKDILIWVNEYGRSELRVQRGFAARLAPAIERAHAGGVTWDARQCILTAYEGENKSDLMQLANPKR